MNTSKLRTKKTRKVLEKTKNMSVFSRFHKATFPDNSGSAHMKVLTAAISFSQHWQKLKLIGFSKKDLPPFYPNFYPNIIFSTFLLYQVLSSLLMMLLFVFDLL
eukprot:g74910.t1